MMKLKSRHLNMIKKLKNVKVESVRFFKVQCLCILHSEMNIYLFYKFIETCF